MSLDIPGTLRSMGDANTRKREDHSGYKFGKNLFTYRIDAKLRMTPVSKISGPRGDYYRRLATGTTTSSEARSRTYQSKMELPPLRRGEPAPAKYGAEDSMRRELHHITTEGRKDTNSPFYKESTLFKFEREGKGVDRRGSYFLNTTTGRRSISSLYIHSEVQAAAHAHDGAGQELVRQLFDRITAAATSANERDGLEVVLVTATWSGDSDPNTVCDGACKGALTHLSQIIDREIEKQRQKYKAELRKKGIYLRASQEYSLSGHVQGHNEFGTVGVGAHRPPGGGPMRSRPSNRVVTEYWH